VIIYGWGRQTRRTLGVVGISKCSHCQATSDFHLVQRRTWITLFFIPIIPYRFDYLVLCGACEWGWKPEDAEVVQLKAKLNASVSTPARPAAIVESIASPWHPGDLVTPRNGASLRRAPGASEATTSADRASPAVVLAVRGSSIQVRDSAGRIGWLQAGEVE
jgi:zinc ribbon protein